MYIDPIVGRTDWKYPLQSSTPSPTFAVSELVKNERMLNGWLSEGSIRTMTFKAFVEGRCQTLQSKESQLETYRDSRQDTILLRMIARNKTLQESIRAVRLSFRKL